MAATSFNAFWAGPDKFSFSSLYHHHSTHCPSPSHSRHGSMYNQFGGDDGQDSHSDFDVSSPSDSAGSPAVSVSQDSIDSDTSDIIWGDGAESESSAVEQDDGDYESQVDSDYDKFPTWIHRDDDFPSLKRYTPMEMPPFIPQSIPTLPYLESHVQPHYFFIQQPTQLIPQPVVLNASNDLTLVPSPSETAMASTGNPLTMMSQTAVPSVSSVQPVAAPASGRKARANKKHARKPEEDDDYRAEEDESLDAMHKACRVHNCLVCTRDLPDSLKVAQPSWAAILRIVFYTLKVNYPQKEFFNLRSNVYDFVDAHWERICIGKVKSEHWKKQLQDTLAHNKKLFASGAEVFKQKGFWRLDDLTDPWEDSKGGSTYSTHVFPKSSTTPVVLAQPPLGMGTPEFGGVAMGGGDDDDYSPAPRKRKARAHKKAKLDS